MISNRTVHTHGFTVQRQSALFTGPTTTLLRKKILKMSLTALFTRLRVSLVQLFVKVHNEKVEFSKSA